MSLQFVINTVITKNVYSIHIHCLLFPKLEKRGPQLIANVIVTRLFWQFWIANNLLGKNLTRKFFLNYLNPPNLFLYRKIPIMYGEWNTPIFHELIVTEFDIQAFFNLFWANLVKKIKIMFMMKFGTQSNLSMLNSMVTFSFSVLDGKFNQGKFNQTYRIVCLR